MIKFIRSKDFQHVKDLGEGACGKTVLLYDEMIDEQYVCKKYSPQNEDNTVVLYKNFINEAKTLQKVFHKNIVRFYNCFLYPELHTGYILMEYIEGDDIDTYLEEAPEMINEIFKQVIHGFSYLESNGILHRDIRPKNILVDNNDILKIIDFGFSKKIIKQDDFDNSISLNWWCDPPSEFSDNIYDFSTEIYFVGKLIEEIIVRNEIDNFKYKAILNRMTQKNPGKRIDSFSAVENELNRDNYLEIEFDNFERNTYLSFSEKLCEIIVRIESGTKYETNSDTILRELKEIYKKCMLEDFIPDIRVLTRVFLKGTYQFNKIEFETYKIRNFIELLQRSAKEKCNLIISNLINKLDAIERYKDNGFEDDIPF